MENFYGCPYDFIEIFDGPQNESFSLGKFCSGTTPMFTSSANRLTVVFHSDAIVTNVGFYASYESLAQGENSTGRFLGHLSPWLCLVMTVSGWTADSRLGTGAWKGVRGSLVYPQDQTRESGTPSTALKPRAHMHLLTLKSITLNWEVSSADRVLESVH